MLEQDVRQWMWFVRQGNEFVRDLMPVHFNGRNITQAMRDTAPLLVEFIHEYLVQNRFSGLQEHYAELGDIGLYYRRVQGVGYLRLQGVRFPAEWGEEIAKDILANAMVGDELGTGREMLEQYNTDLTEFVDFCLEEEIDLDMDDFVRAFRDTTNNV